MKKWRKYWKKKPEVRKIPKKNRSKSDLTISIYEDQKEWLLENNSSASRFLREALDELKWADENEA